MKTYLLSLAMASLLIAGCSSKKKTDNSNSQTVPVIESSGNNFNFAFVGCNRVEYGDRDNSAATDASTANLSALKRIFKEISTMENKPEILFFLGDLVLAESTTGALDSQLVSWVNLYQDSTFSKIQQSGIELVAVPGNHEMLYYKDYGIPKHDEWPLKGASKVWMKHMAPYMPKDRDRVTGSDSVVNQMTFSFVRHNVGFVVMNTDTYNAPTEKDPYGVEGIIPTDWIVAKVQEYQQDPNIDHIFVLGHKPYYVSGKPETGHDGLPEGPVLWPKLNEAHVVAMLSAHVHDYQRVQPEDQGTYQVVAGNGGSKGTATFFGYSVVHITKGQEPLLISRGYDIGDPYYAAVPQNPFTTRDSTLLSWTKNANPYSVQ